MAELNHSSLLAADLAVTRAMEAGGYTITTADAVRMGIAAYLDAEAEREPHEPCDDCCENCFDVFAAAVAREFSKLEECLEHCHHHPHHGEAVTIGFAPQTPQPEGEASMATPFPLGDNESVVVDIFPADAGGNNTDQAFDAGSVTATLSDTVEASVTVDPSQTFVTITALGPIDTPPDSMTVAGTLNGAALSGVFQFQIEAGPATQIGFAPQTPTTNP